MAPWKQKWSEGYHVQWGQPLATASLRLTGKFIQPTKEFGGVGGVLSEETSKSKRKNLQKLAFKGLGPHLITLEIHTQKCDWTVKDHCMMLVTWTIDTQTVTHPNNLSHTHTHTLLLHFCFCWRNLQDEEPLVSLLGHSLWNEWLHVLLAKPTLSWRQIFVRWGKSAQH